MRALCVACDGERFRFTNDKYFWLITPLTIIKTFAVDLFDSFDGRSGCSVFEKRKQRPNKKAKIHTKLISKAAKVGCRWMTQA